VKRVKRRPTPASRNGQGSVCPVRAQGREARPELFPVTRVVLPYHHPQLRERSHRRGYLLQDLRGGRAGRTDGPDDEVMLRRPASPQLEGLDLSYPVMDACQRIMHGRCIRVWWQVVPQYVQGQPLEASGFQRRTDVFGIHVGAVTWFAAHGLTVSPLNAWRVVVAVAPREGGGFGEKERGFDAVLEYSEFDFERVGHERQVDGRFKDHLGRQKEFFQVRPLEFVKCEPGGCIYVHFHLSCSYRRAVRRPSVAHSWGAYLS
jgi:hypothetical protein